MVVVREQCKVRQVVRVCVTNLWLLKEGTPLIQCKIQGGKKKAFEICWTMEPQVLTVDTQMWVVKNAVSLEEQRGLLAAILGPGMERQRYRYGFMKLRHFEASAVMGTVFTDVLRKTKQMVASMGPQEGLQMGGKVANFELGYVEVSGTHESNFSSQSHSLKCLGYEKDSVLHAHVDHVEGLNIIVSIGATANFEFFVGTTQAIPDKMERVQLHSGDAVIFPTDGKSSVWHRITGFEDNVPQWFDVPSFVRVCVQYRSVEALRPPPPVE